MQHGLGERGGVDPNSGLLITGPESLSEVDLSHNRTDMDKYALAHPLEDAHVLEHGGDDEAVAGPPDPGREEPDERLPTGRFGGKDVPRALGSLKGGGHLDRAGHRWHPTRGPRRGLPDCAMLTGLSAGQLPPLPGSTR